MTSNRPVYDLPELAAVKTRIAVMHLQASDSELRALMRRVALNGSEQEGKTLSPGEMQSRVCEYIIDQSLASAPRRSTCESWSTASRTSCCGMTGKAAVTGATWWPAAARGIRPTAFREKVAARRRAAQKQKETEIVREIAAATSGPPAAPATVGERVGKSESALYRRTKDLGEK